MEALIVCRVFKIHPLILANLRELEQVVKEEVEKMPILIDILENKVLGPEFRRGVQEGELLLVRRLIEKRFGPIPAWADERLHKISTAELEDVGLRLLDAANLEELLKCCQRGTPLPSVPPAP